MGNNISTFNFLKRLPEPFILEIFHHIPDDHILALISSDFKFAQIVIGSSKLSSRLTVTLDSAMIESITASEMLQRIRFKKIVVDKKINNWHQLEKVVSVLRLYSKSIETLTLTPNVSKNVSDWHAIFNESRNIRILKLTGTMLKNVENHLSPFFTELQNLEFIEFEKCDASCFKAFKGHRSLRKLCITNRDFVPTGFDYLKFIELMKTLSIQELVFKGVGTAGFFDVCNEAFKTLTIEAEAVTFIVGSELYPRITYLHALAKEQLESQTMQDYLKHLTIHQLPNDYDGGKIMRYILEEMNLQTFKYGDIFLIQHGQKCDVKTIWANEIQLGSLYELMRHYKDTIKQLSFAIAFSYSSQVDLNGKAIKSMVGPSTDLFENIKVFDVLDKSNYHHRFGLFLSLFRQMKNVEFFSIRTQDRNINVILEECLPRMGNLKEIYLTSTARRHERRFDIIQRCVPNLKRIWLAPEYINQDTRKRLGGNVEILEIDTNSITDIKPTHLHELAPNF